MNMNDEQLKKAIASLRASVMGDRKVDLAVGGWWAVRDSDPRP